MQTSKTEKRIEELQRGFRSADLDRAECAALVFLLNIGTTPEESIHVEGKDQWAARAADAIVWTVRRLRTYETQGHRDHNDRRVITEVMRGHAQMREHMGRNGGFLPCDLSDHIVMIQNRLERAIEGRNGREPLLPSE